MKISGELHIGFGTELNQFGQRPLEVYFTGPDNMRLDIMGVRFKEGHVLDAQAVTSRGWAVYHTQFSPQLQSAIKEARQKEQL